MFISLRAFFLKRFALPNRCFLRLLGAPTRRFPTRLFLPNGRIPQRFGHRQAISKYVCCCSTGISPNFWSTGTPLCHRCPSSGQQAFSDSWPPAYRFPNCLWSDRCSAKLPKAFGHRRQHSRGSVDTKFPCPPRASHRKRLGPKTHSSKQRAPHPQPNFMAPLGRLPNICIDSIDVERRLGGAGPVTCRPHVGRTRVCLDRREHSPDRAQASRHAFGTDCAISRKPRALCIVDILHRGGICVA